MSSLLLDLRVMATGDRYVVSNADTFHINAGCGCTGTGAWKRWLDDIVDVWWYEYNIDVKFHSKFMVEKDKHKRAFILQEHPELNCLLEDTKQFGDKVVFNEIAQEHAHLDWVSIFGSAFSCTGVTKQNRHHAENIGCLRKVDTESGITFAHNLPYFEKRRPSIAFLENTKDILIGSYIEDECQIVSVVAYVAVCLALQGMSVV